MTSDPDGELRVVGDANVVLLVTPHGDEWFSVRDPAVSHQYMDQLVLPDGQGHRVAPFLAAAAGALALIEVTAGLPVPPVALGLSRALAWLHDGAGAGPAARPRRAGAAGAVGAWRPRSPADGLRRRNGRGRRAGGQRRRRDGGQLLRVRPMRPREPEIIPVRGHGVPT